MKMKKIKKKRFSKSKKNGVFFTLTIFLFYSIRDDVLRSGTKRWVIVPSRIF